jgi:hypothetical protein
MKRIFDPSFRYTSSYETDVRKTFERIRREQNLPNPPREAGQNVHRLESRKAGSK